MGGRGYSSIRQGSASGSGSDSNSLPSSPSTSGSDSDSDPYSKNSKPVSFFFFFPYSASFFLTAEKLTGHMPAFWNECLIVRTVKVLSRICEGSLADLREVSEEGLNVVFRLV